MRALHAIGAAFLMACAMPATSHAEVATGASEVSPPPAAGCDRPGLQHCDAWHPRRHVRFHAWHRRHGRPAPIALAPPPAYWPVAPAYYNAPVPSPYNSAYSRVMSQHFRSYRLAAGGAVFEYDLMADAYVPLAQSDAQRALGVAALRR